MTPRLVNLFNLQAIHYEKHGRMTSNNRYKSKSLYREKFIPYFSNIREKYEVFVFVFKKFNFNIIEIIFYTLNTKDQKQIFLIIESNNYVQF